MSASRDQEIAELEAYLAKTDVFDKQVGGEHYKKHAIQPWHIIEEYRLDFWEGSALKYLLRDKPGTFRAEDIKKAIHYLEYCLERLGACPARSTTEPPAP